MTPAIKHAASTVLRAFPTLATLALLGGIGYLGHRTGWKIPAAAAVFHEEPAAEEEWCADHGAPEATCLICRGREVTATPPSQHSHKGLHPEAAMELPVAEPSVEGGKPRPVVQLPSAGVLEAAGVETGVSQMRPMSEFIEANAELGYDMTRYAQVSTRAPGAAVLVRAHAGQQVRKGDVVALVDAAEVGRAKAEFTQAATQLASRRAALERIKTSAAAGFRNQSELPTVEAEVREAGLRAAGARQAIGNLGLPTATLNPDEPPTERQMQLLGLLPEVAKELDGNTVTSNLLPVVSPLDGTVVSQGVVAGEVVDVARTLFVIADTSRVWLTAELAPKDAAHVRIGQAISFIPDGGSGEACTGSISWVSTEVSDKTRTVRVRAEVLNPDGRLLAHTFGRARIEVRSAAAALVVPEEAVQPDGPASLVFVRLNEEVYRPRVVRLGAHSGGFVEVLAGLEAGETIVTRGSYVLAAQANRGKLGAGCCGEE